MKISEIGIAFDNEPASVTAPKKKTKIHKHIKAFVMKCLTLALTLISLSYIPYVVLGVFNRVFRVINSVFLCYAGDRKYAKHYLFSFSEKSFRWVPVPIGVFEQGGKWGLLFGTPMIEDDFTFHANHKRLKKLTKRLNTIAWLMGVKDVNYAGILPSYLYQMGDISSDNHNAKPGLVVFKAYQELTQRVFQSEVPVILLGGAGSVGSYIQTHLREQGIEYYVVDPRIGINALPTELVEQPAILIDTARKGVLEQYQGQFWQGLTILNKTYPEPPKAFVERLNSIGVDVFHLSGVEGKCLPSLPHGYSNSIPCCAIHADVFEAKPVLMEL